MKWNPLIRQSPRWLSIVFTLLVVVNVVVNFFVQGQETLAVWVGVSTPFPLFLLLCSGLYLFAQPYVSRRRVMRGTGE